MISSGRWTLTAETPIPDFAMPYAAPKVENTKLTQQPIAPKKLCGVLGKPLRFGATKSTYSVYRTVGRYQISSDFDVQHEKLR